MKSTKDIPKGYKQSPVGLIPKDWEVKRLGEIGSFSKGYGVPKNKMISEGYPCLTYGDLYTKYDYLIENIHSYIDKKTASESKAINKGDILFAGSGETPEDIGKCATYLGKETIFAGGDIIILTPTKDYNSFVLSYILNSDIGGKQRYKYAQGHSVVHIYPDTLKKIQIPIPPLAEQQKIAEILSSWDKAIELQTSIIDKLTLRKKGLMQQLLTGKKRLKGFTEPWNKIRLGAIGKTYNGLAGITKDDFEEGSDKYIPYINIYMNGVVNTSELGSVRINSRQNTVAYGDILFTTSSETPNEVGFSSVLLNEVDNLYLNSFCFGYRLINFNSLIPQYAAYYFRSNIFRKKMYKLAQGSTRFNISKEEVMKLMVELPPEQEQSAIADVLSTTDKTIQKEKQKLEALKQQKKGLMQQLLTGKRRV